VAELIPTRFVAGTTFRVVLTLGAYPAPVWGASLILRGPLSIDLTATDDGAQHVLTESAAVTADWPAGVYWWAIRATDSDNVVQVDEGQITVAGDIAAADDGFDARSHAERTLAAIEAVIENRATTDQQKYTINNRELWRTPIADLLLLRNRYRDEVRRQKQARGGQSLLGRQVKVRF
jgi:hypothetical protein